MTSTATPPAELLRDVPATVREAVLCELLAELIRRQGGATPIPITTADGRELGHFVATEAAAEAFRRHGPRLTPDEVDEIDRRLDRLHEAVPIEQVIADLRASAAGPRTRPG